LEELSKRSIQKINHIATVAERLFLSQGVRAIPIEQIVTEAQVSKATFYKYFKNKEELLSYLFKKIGDEYKEKLESLIAKSKESNLTVEDFLSLFAEETYDKYYKSDFVMELMQDYPSLLESLNIHYMTEIVPTYKEFIRIAKIDGIIRMDIDPDVFMAYTMIVKKGLREVFQPPPGMDMMEYTKQLLDMYLYGIMERKS